MNFYTFIANRIFSAGKRSRYSSPIISIARTGIAIGVGLMILSICVVLGFQEEIRKKVVGFGSHIQIIENSDFISRESQRLLIYQEFYPSLDTIEGVDHIQVFATKPGILETPENIQGVIIKGVGSDFNWEFFEKHIIAGAKLDLKGEKSSSDVMISEVIANRLGLELGSKLTLYFVQSSEDVKPRNFTVTGVYNTGLEEFDAEYVFVDIGHHQKLSGWGLEAQILVDTTGSMPTVEALAFGGDGDYLFKWNYPGWKGRGPHSYCPQDTDNLELIVKDGSHTVPDTAWLSPIGSQNCLADSFVVTTSGGTYDQYCGGFEVFLSDYNYLFEMDDLIYTKIPYQMQTYNIKQQSPEIFSWLEMIDINVIIIIVLMILISIINMTSALLIIILERTQMIGLLKSLGSTNEEVMRIFLRNAMRIIFYGMVFGNVIGLGLAWMQDATALIKLDPENYFVSAVPIKINLLYILALDLGTLLICGLVLILPAYYVSTISPARAMRID